MYRFYRFLLLVLFKTFYFHKVIGLENLPNGPCIIAPNHASYLDPPLIAVSCQEDVFFLAKFNLFKVPLLGKLMIKLHSYPVGGTGNDLNSFKLVSQLLKENKKVVIFPEGHRTANGQLLPVKYGTAMLALKTGCPIVPVYIQGTYEIWPRNQKLPKIRGKTLCVVGKPLEMSEFSSLGKKEAQELLSKQLQKSIKDLSSPYHL